MPTGHINATSLNLRAEPNGDVLAIIPHDAAVDIKTDDGSGWLLVAATIDGETRLGFVDGRYVVQDAQTPPEQKPAGGAPAAAAIPAPPPLQPISAPLRNGKPEWTPTSLKRDLREASKYMDA